MSKTRRNIIHNTNGNGHTNRLQNLFNKQDKENETSIDYSLLRQAEGRTENQKKYIRTIIKNHITFCTGPAGSGKTHLAAAIAATYLSKRIVDRIVLVRPIVNCDEEVGFLPGDLNKKTDPYTRPIFDEFCDFFTDAQINTFCGGRRPIIEVVPLGMMKGRTFKKAFIVLDEAQDATYKQLKNFLTRMGEASKIVITGDITQSDRHNNYDDVPMHIVMNKLEGVDGIGFSRMDPGDNQRHPMVSQILERV